MALANLQKTYRKPSLIIFSLTEPIAGTGDNSGQWDFAPSTPLYLPMTIDHLYPLLHKELNLGEE